MVAVPLMSAGPSIKNLTFWVTSSALCHSHVPFWITRICSSLLRVTGLLSGPGACSDRLPCNPRQFCRITCVCFILVVMNKFWYVSMDWDHYYTHWELAKMGSTILGPLCLVIVRSEER